MARSELKTTSFDPAQIKESLIEFLQETEQFGDFNFEGSAINTIVDLLVHNTTYNAYLANMLANESFISSAQLRANVSSHAQKLSYTPRSATASQVMGQLEVIPSSTSNLASYVVADPGFTLLATVDNTTYTFTTKESYTLNLDEQTNTYKQDEVQLFQGQLITNRFVYKGVAITIPNRSIDTSTMNVTVGGEVYKKANSLTELAFDNRVFFLSENHDQRYTIEFGKDILGVEPSEDEIVEITYINTEDNHANGLSTFVSANTIAGYSNITFNSDGPAWGGAPRESIEEIRFTAPKFYQAQNRALTNSDYGPLVKQQYPFIRSIISWGGEDNDPPQYGTVFLSVISDEGAFLSGAIKQSVVEYLSDYNVGSVTPEIVDPKPIGINVDVQFSYNNKIATRSYNELSLQLRTILNDYNEGDINEFYKYFNESEIVRRMMTVQGLSSVTVDKTVYVNIPTVDFNDPVYEFNFENALKPGTIQASGFKIDVNGTNHKLYDENGLLYVSYTRGGSTQTIEVGDVDYDKGSFSFTINVIDDTDTLTVHAEPVEENFYVNTNKYIFIDDINISLLPSQRV